MTIDLSKIDLVPAGSECHDGSSAEFGTVHLNSIEPHSFDRAGVSPDIFCAAGYQTRLLAQSIRGIAFAHVPH